MSLSRSQYYSLIKIVLVGDSGVGKTNLILRLTQNQFHDNTPFTIGADFSSYELTLDDKVMKLGIWDTAGKI